MHGDTRWNRVSVRYVESGCDIQPERYTIRIAFWNCKRIALGESNSVLYLNAEYNAVA